MKVLIMTLQNPPPTLGSEHAAKFSDEYKDFIAACLKKDPSDRLTSAELLQHPLFAKGVEKPEDLENLIAQLPPIGSRGGAGQKQLYKQLTKASTVSRSGIWERSSRGQGWDFGDEIPNASSETVVSVGRSDESDSGGHKQPSVLGSDEQFSASGTDNAGGDRRYSFGAYDQDSMSRADQSADGFTANPKALSVPMFAMTADGKMMKSGNVSAASMPAKTVGMLRKGRFTVSDVAVPDKDKVETKLADFLDDNSSAGGISNSSSFTNMPPQSADGSPTTGQNNAVSTNSAHSQSTHGGAALAASSESSSATATATAAAILAQNSSAPVVILTPSALPGNSNTASITASAPSSSANSAQSRQGRQSLPLEHDASITSTQATSSQPGPPVTSTRRKSRSRCQMWKLVILSQRRQGPLHRPFQVPVVPHPASRARCMLRRSREAKAGSKSKILTLAHARLCPLPPLVRFRPSSCRLARTHRPPQCRSSPRRRYSRNLARNSHHNFLLRLSHRSKFGRPSGHRQNHSLLRRLR